MSLCPTKCPYVRQKCPYVRQNVLMSDKMCPYVRQLIITRIKGRFAAGLSCFALRPGALHLPNVRPLTTYPHPPATSRTQPHPTAPANSRTLPYPPTINRTIPHTAAYSRTHPHPHTHNHTHSPTLPEQKILKETLLWQTAIV